MEKKGDGCVYFMDRIWVPLVDDVRTTIMDEARATRYSIHLEANKMYYDFKDMYWWLVDRLTKSAHFLATRKDYRMEKLSRLYINEIVARHGVLVLVISDRDVRCVAVLENIAESLRNTLEYVMYRSPVLWAKVKKNRLIRPEMGVVRFGKKGKLAPRYVGPFEILERIGLVAYQLRLPQELSGVHETFHVSNLRKCLANANLHMPLEEIRVDKTLCFVEEHAEIMDRKVKKSKHSRILIVKVCWNSKSGPEFTWERVDFMKTKYSHLFVESDGYAYPKLCELLDRKGEPNEVKEGKVLG
nr:putative reverse transcriptase domain-containing protein [Tanacetum cinerariifolium]